MIRIAVLGGGIFAQKCHVPALNELVKLKRISVVAVYSRSETSATSTKELLQPNENIKVYWGNTLDAIWDDKSIDAVDVCLPIDIQPSVILQAFKAGKHVISEKPIAPYCKIGEELISEYEKHFKTCLWGIAENYCYEPYFKEAKKYIEEGKIGSIRVVVTNAFSFMSVESPYFNTQWRRDPKYVGGYLLDGGVHIIAGLRLLVGDIEILSGYAKLFREEIGIGPTDSLACSFKCKNGALGTLALSYACNNTVASFKEHAPPLYTIVGDKGTLFVSRDKLELLITDETGKTQSIKPNLTRKDNQTAIEEELNYFVESILTKSPSLLYSPQQALQDVLFIEKLTQYT